MESASRSRSPAEEAWALLSDLFQGQRRRFFAIAQEFQLAPQQIMALKALGSRGPIPMSELAGALDCDTSNVTGIVDRLEERGLVERRAAPHDRRVKMLVLTDHGEEVRVELDRRLSEPPAFISALSREDQRALRDILQRATED